MRPCFELVKSLTEAIVLIILNQNGSETCLRASVDLVKSLKLAGIDAQTAICRLGKKLERNVYDLDRNWLALPRPRPSVALIKSVKESKEL